MFQYVSCPSRYHSVSMLVLCLTLCRDKLDMLKTIWVTLTSEHVRLPRVAVRSVPVILPFTRRNCRDAYSLLLSQPFESAVLNSLILASFVAHRGLQRRLLSRTTREGISGELVDAADRTSDSVVGDTLCGVGGGCARRGQALEWIRTAYVVYYNVL